MRPSGTRASGSKRRPGRPFQGRAHARGMLVEATWVAAKITGPLRAFFERVRARRGMQIAVVATAQAGGALWHLVVKGEGLRLPAPVADREEAARSSLRAALVADWQAKAPATRAGAGAATGERL